MGRNTEEDTWFPSFFWENLVLPRFGRFWENSVLQDCSHWNRIAWLPRVTVSTMPATVSKPQWDDTLHWWDKQTKCFLNFGEIWRAEIFGQISGRYKPFIASKLPKLNLSLFFKKLGFGWCKFGIQLVHIWYTMYTIHSACSHLVYTFSLFTRLCSQLCPVCPLDSALFNVKHTQKCHSRQKVEQ